MRPRLLILLLAMFCSIPVGYAMGEGTSDPQDPFYEEVAGLTPAPPPGNGKEVDYAIEGPMDQSVVDRCRADEQAYDDPLICDMIVAVDEGRLEPGSYDEAQLRQLLGQ